MSVAEYFHEHKSWWVVKFFRFLTDFGYSKIYLVGAFLLGLYFLFKKELQNAFKALIFFVSIAISGITVNIIKFFFGRARPDAFFSDGLEGFYFFESTYQLVSFPSGHSATAMGVGVMLSLYLPRFAWFFIPFFTLVVFSRVAVLAHFLSDALVGAFIGGLVSYMLYKRFIQKRVF